MKRLKRFGGVIGVIIALLWAVLPISAAECMFTDFTTFDEKAAQECRIKVTDASVTQFNSPKLSEDTLFGRRWYGRLADNANIYADTTRAAPIVRNVGDGYLFATVNTQLTNDAGETWYQINFGEYVHADDISLAEPSDFSGVTINQQPERPFGWIVQEVRPSSEPEGEPDKNLPKLERFDFVEVFDIVLGENDWLWYDIGNGHWIKQTFMSIVDVDPRPDEVKSDEFWVEVDLYEQTFAAYEGDRMVYATLISSGLNQWPTREGLFQIGDGDRFTEYKMSGAEGLIDYYYLEDIPYIMYFDQLNDIALHGTYWHDRFGFKHSHGCVNMPIKDAEWTFNWSADAPNDLWVWVHTSDPLIHLAQFANIFQ